MGQYVTGMFFMGWVALAFVWRILALVQVFLGYGTAYRLTRAGGNNGVSLCGWMFVMSLAAAVPGLGVYLWWKYRYL